MTPSTELVSRLCHEDVVWINLKGILHHKKLRNPDGPEAANHITSLEARIAELEGRIGATLAVVEQGYPGTGKTDQCEHGKYGFEDCIACYDEALTNALTGASLDKGDRPNSVEGDVSG